MERISSFVDAGLMQLYVIILNANKHKHGSTKKNTMARMKVKATLSTTESCVHGSDEISKQPKKAQIRRKTGSHQIHFVQD